MYCDNFFHNIYDKTSLLYFLICAFLYFNVDHSVLSMQKK